MIFKLKTETETNYFHPLVVVKYIYLLVNLHIKLVNVFIFCKRIH